VNSPLTQIQEFASKAHEGQRRKYEDAPYIVHPIRVMELCNQYTKNPAVLAAALLHDVLEDTPVTRKDLHDFLLTVFPPHQATTAIELVDGLTDRFTRKNHPELNRRRRKQKEAERLAACSGDTQTVKYADIIDNCQTIVTGKDDFAGIYLHECRALLKHMDKGNTQLYQRAVSTVEECFKKFNDPSLRLE
jgi:guanosine-3',5'-bis(diphosphate) 3'-pyrophosphohydrolase